MRRLLGEPMLRVAARRLVLAVPLLFIVSALSFVLVSLTPGDAARQILGVYASPDLYERLRAALGLDLPIHEQYWRWVSQAVQGDFGRSLFTSEAVTHAIHARLPVTLSLIMGTMLFTALFGVGLGVLSAVRGGVVGRSVDALALVAFALPTYWVGSVLISVFAVNVGWLPATGYIPFTQSPGGWLRSLALPVLALTLVCVASVAKQTREAMLDALGSEYIRMARASGISSASIIFRHALKNAALPVVTVGGLLIIGLLGYTVFVEYVFGLPGLGGLAVAATTEHDLPMIQGVVVYFTLIVVVVNLTIDMTYAWLNPRVRVQ